MREINKIVEAYEVKQNRLTKPKKYEALLAKKEEISKKDLDVKKSNLHLERLKEEREKYKDALSLSDMAIRDEYDKEIKKEEERFLGEKSDLEKLKEEKTSLIVDRNKVNREAKKKIIQKMNENQDQLRKDLVAERKRLELKQEELKKQMEQKKQEYNNFNYKYDKETLLPLNHEEYRKINDEIMNLYEMMRVTDEDRKFCIKKLEENKEVITEIPELPEDYIYDESVLSKVKEAPEIGKTESKGKEETKREDFVGGSKVVNSEIADSEGKENTEIEESEKEALDDKDIEDSEIEKVEGKEAENPEIKESEDREIESSEMANSEPEEIEEENLTKIEIGRTGRITFKGKEYKVDKNVIKEGLNLSEEETLDILKDKLQMSQEGEYIDIIRDGIKQRIIDSTVINTIISSKMEEPEELSLLSEYVLNCAKAKEGREYKNICNVTYNEEDLSKSNFLSRIFKKEINANDKVEMLHRAMVGKRYAIANSVGEYKPDLVSRVMSRITGNKVPLLSQRIDSVHKVANVYNELRDEDKVSDKEKFKEGLRVNVHASRFSEEQHNEINELRNSQIKQEDTER